MIRDMPLGELAEFNAWSCSCSDANLNGCRKGFRGILQQGLLLIGSDVSDPVGGPGKAEASKGTLRDHAGFTAIVACTLHGLMRVRVPPWVQLS